MSQHSFSLQRGFKPRGGGEAMHSHDDAQLTFAVSGVVQLHTSEGRWLVPSQLGVWVPAGVLHHVEVLSDAELWLVRWEPSAAQASSPPAPLERTFAFRVTPLMRSLVHAAFTDNPSADKTELLVKLMLHELTETAHAPTYLPMPRSSAARRAADIAFGDFRKLLSVHEIASRAATSMRTISRLFQAETGLSFKVWRQRARIVQSMDRLAQGKAISQVSAELGYASVASFSSAFRQVTSMTPSKFLGRSE